MEDSSNSAKWSRAAGFQLLHFAIPETIIKRRVLFYTLYGRSGRILAIEDDIQTHEHPEWLFELLHQTRELRREARALQARLRTIARDLADCGFVFTKPERADGNFPDP